ncbi:hypothetical protein [uncultured Rhodospira sp.]|uniref:hypothetical protein n=1 Tax=uncultured Rhodospira sp. TaxID=1936189 RepID=UPI00261EC5F7|nr:hypothetical protein [uncultured Rhodospira sp.]
MLVRPMIGEWEPRGIETVATAEARHLVRMPVPGLAGDLHQDLGRAALAVTLSGTLAGDEARDGFLESLREQFAAGEPVDFVADILTDSDLEQVLIRDFRLSEVAGSADSFRYAITLVEYTEPPEPPGLPGLDLGLDVDLGLDIDLGLDLLDLPGLLFDVPSFDDMLSPIGTAAESLKSALGGAGSLLDPLNAILD